MSDFIAESLDSVRSKALRITLSSQALRNIFISKSKRLFLFYCITAILALGTSLFFPLWSLLLGPFLYGVPHLYSSLRYIHHALHSKVPTDQRTSPGRAPSQAFIFFTLIFTLITSLRLWMYTHSITTEHLPLGELLPEWISYVVTFIGCVFLYRRSFQEVIQGLFLSTFILILTWHFPLELAGLIMLAHHFVGFFFWINFSKEKRSERRVAITCTFLFCILHLLIFLGVFDPLYTLFSPSGEIAWAELEYSQIGSLILPRATHYTTWFHATTAYAFGQTLHYFIWLKAIPDQHHYHSTPTTFRQSLKLLREDFPTSTLIIGALASCALFLIWMIWNYPLARTLYFILASYHGFMELAALSLLSRRSPT